MEEIIPSLPHQVRGKFRQKHNIVVSGPSSCGKTTWVLNLLAHKEFFDLPPERVVWCTATPSEEISLELTRLQYPFEIRSTIEPGLLDIDNETVRPRDFWVVDDLAKDLQKSVVNQT